MDLSPDFVFGPQGPLSKKLPYFDYRPSQVEFARAVRDAFTSKKVAILEAQTGTGKTLAYLIPAIESKRRVIVSTGTKALQEQLYYKDLPLLREKLHLNFQYLLMKGRMNYLCLLRFERLQTEPMLPDQESVDQFQEIRQWASETETGDIAEASIPEQAPIWKLLTISADACLGSKCRFYNQCYVVRLKQRAEQAHIIVVNHHLFFSDLSLQILNSTSIFPPSDIVIFDEAHQLPEVAAHNLSIQFSQRSFAELQEDLLKELKILRLKEGLEVSGTLDKARKLYASVESLFEKFAPLPQKVRYDPETISRIVETHGTVVNGMFAMLLEELMKYVEKTEDMPQIYRRFANHHSSLSFLLNATEDAYVYWAERNEHREWSLQASPLDVSKILQESLWPNLQTAILTSATLFIDKNCGPIKEDLGLSNCVEHTFPYNFDYPSQACLYVPRHLPDPASDSFASKAAEEIARLVEVTEGGTFVLCTSYNNMRTYEVELSKLNYPLLVQGKGSKQRLIKSFMKNKGSVLLATMSFWQGIDIQGDALVSVIIDKLPFAVPNDPFIEAKIQYLKKMGKNPFLDYQLPSAVMMLKQGLGRLIRTSVDYGLLAVLDSRLLTKSYGKVFLRNLPPLPIIQKINDLKTAFQERRDRFIKYH